MTEPFYLNVIFHHGFVADPQNAVTAQESNTTLAFNYIFNVYNCIASICDHLGTVV